METFAKFIGRLPFAGKMVIKPIVFSLYQTTSKSEGNKSYAQLMALLVLFGLLHSVQMCMGIDAMLLSSPMWAKTVSTLYVLVNFCVILTQVHLCYRATRFFFKGSYPRIRRSYKDYSDTEIVTMLSVTIGVQIVFLSQYIWYN